MYVEIAFCLNIYALFLNRRNLFLKVICCALVFANLIMNNVSNDHFYVEIYKTFSKLKTHNLVPITKYFYLEYPTHICFCSLFHLHLK